MKKKDKLASPSGTTGIAGKRQGSLNETVTGLAD